MQTQLDHFLAQSVVINTPDLASVRVYWGNNRVKNFHCELYIVSEMVAHFLPEFVQSFKGNLLYFLFSVREVPISTKL